MFLYQNQMRNLVQKKYFTGPPAAGLILVPNMSKNTTLRTVEVTNQIQLALIYHLHLLK